MSASAAQLDIGFAPVPPRAETLELAFFAFHRSNPEVFTRLVELARAEVNAQLGAGIKRPRVAIKALWEMLRAELRGRPVQSGGPVKLNNNFTALYSRLIAEMHADLRNVFRMRERSL
jgi:glutathione S-transferase